MKKVLLMLSLSIGTLFGCGGNSAKNNAEDSFTTASGQTIAFHPLGHGSVRMTIDNSVVYFDPVICMLPEGGDFADAPKADYIFITHSHYDHLDTLAISQLSKESTVVVCNAESAAQLEGARVAAPGDSMDLGSIKVEVVPAYNYSEEKLGFHPAGRDNGYVVSVDGFRVYVAGDTEDIPEMAQLKDINVAFLPCNLPYTMTPEQVNAAARMFMPEVLFPYHYGETEISRVRELLSDTDIDVRIRQYK